MILESTELSLPMVPSQAEKVTTGELCHEATIYEQRPQGTRCSRKVPKSNGKRGAEIVDLNIGLDAFSQGAEARAIDISVVGQCVLSRTQAPS